MFTSKRKRTNSQGRYNNHNLAYYLSTGPIVSALCHGGIFPKHLRILAPFWRTLLIVLGAANYLQSGYLSAWDRLNPQSGVRITSGPWTEAGVFDSN